MAYKIIPAESVSDDYLRDESRFTGSAESFSFPESEQDVINIVREMSGKNIPTTLQGARTGLTGGAVPLGGHAMNLAKMNKIAKVEPSSENDVFLITVEPGISLAEFRELLHTSTILEKAAHNNEAALSFIRNSSTWFFPPELTETSATLGGMASCNASGAKSFLYGSIRPWIKALRVVLAGGEVLALSREEHKVKDNRFEVSSISDVVYGGEIPSYLWRNVKNAAGYYSKPEMDVLDLFIGQEGTLGIITSLTFAVIKKPAFIWGVLFSFSSEEAAFKFVSFIQKYRLTFAEVSVASVEYFDKHSIELAQTIEQGHLPMDTSDWEAAVYVEFNGNNEKMLEDAMTAAADTAAVLGGDPDKSVSATLPHELEKISLFRHAVPEAINLRVAQVRQENISITKLSTDFAVPDGKLAELIEVYKRVLEPEGLFSVMFGHIGDNHLHVNIIPETTEQFEKGKYLYTQIAKEVIALGGTISAEHGVGKIKRDFLFMMYGEQGIGEMKRVKRLFDPDFLLNRGNLFIP